MRTLKISLLVFILSISISAQWYQQNSGTTEQLKAVTFIDSVNGFVVGYNGIILNTTNGGQDWLSVQSVDADYLSGVSFVDVNNGWVVGGDSSVILHTTDSGISWLKQSILSLNELYDVAFVDTNFGWIVGGAGKILRTTDGGINWLEQTCSTGETLKGVSFVDSNIGTIVGDRYFIFHTEDGGQNWIHQLSGSLYSLYSVSFVDSNTGWAVGDFIVLKTTNGGTDWIEQTTGVLANFRGVCFTDTSTGTAVGYYVILRTTNGGTDWIEQSGLPPDGILNDVFFIDENIGWAVGYDGLILHTINGGVNSIENEENELPIDYLLSQNYPNPFNPTTSLQYAIGSRQFVSLKVYDILGKEITTIVNEEKPAGSYEVEFDGSRLTSGIYFYRLQAGEYTAVKKMILLK